MKIESYPPPLLPTNFPQNTDPNKRADTAAYNGDEDPIPLTDLRHLDRTNLSQACRDWGLFRLTNHGIPSNLMTQIQDQAKKLFDLSFEYKQGILQSPLAYFWGTAARDATGAPLKTAKNVSWVEVINFPLNQLSQFQAEDPLLDSFRILVEEYGRNMARIARTMYEAMEKDLNLDPKHSKSYLSEPTGFIRVQRYPPVSKGSQAWGVAEHTDSSVLTILIQDHVGGLEVLKDGNWVHVKPAPDTLVVNLGDMIQAISEDEYVSAKHRVKVNNVEDRISICYFVFPDNESLIQTSKYMDFTYKEYFAQAQKDIETLGFKVGLQSFKRAS